MFRWVLPLFLSIFTVPLPAIIARVPRRSNGYGNLLGIKQPRSALWVLHALATMLNLMLMAVNYLKVL